MKTLWMVLLLFFSVGFTCNAATVGPLVIYGEDNRKDLYEVTDSRELAWADSTVAVFLKNQVRPLGNGTVKLSLKSYGASYCEGERFAGQPDGAYCSGFLVAPNIVATAGHCVKNDLSAMTFVFGFGFKNSMDDLSIRPMSDVYYGRTLLGHAKSSTGADFAVVQLDREVIGHDPLPLRTRGALQVDDDLTLVGNPMGIPTKVASGAKVRSLNKQYFVANTDSYGGNSGSAVFNSNTGEVEGILVRGSTDYVYDKTEKCVRSNVCEADGCDGEDATNISEILPFIR